MIPEIENNLLTELLLRFSLESVILLGSFLVIFHLTAFKQLLSRLPILKKRAIYCFFLCWTLVQCADRLQYHFPPAFSFYPLTRFAMYQTGKVGNSINVYKFLYQSEGQLKKRELSVTKKFSSIGLPSVNSRFNHIGELLLSNDLEKRNNGLKQIKIYCRTVAEILIKEDQNPEAVYFQVLLFEKNNQRQFKDHSELLAEECWQN